MLHASNRPGTIEIIRRLLTREIPAVPNIGWNIVDVRDIAASSGSFSRRIRAMS